MEWGRDELADIRRVERALERLRRDLKQRGQWRWMWRIQDVQAELQRVKKAVAGERRSADLLPDPLPAGVDPYTRSGSMTK